MYEQTFEFSSRPFDSVPRLEDFFAGCLLYTSDAADE